MIFFLTDGFYFTSSLDVVSEFTFENSAFFGGGVHELSQ